MDYAHYTHFNGLWRASANEAVHSLGFHSDAILTMTEFWDNGLGVGDATEIKTLFELTTTKCKFILSDNGKGLHNQRRMLSWSSKEIGNDATENVYGHGSKKALTKWMPDFTTANWKLMWRKQDSRGFSGCLNVLESPYLGLETKHTEIDGQDDICPGQGTQWEVEFDLSVLGKANTPQKLMESLQEIIRTRYNTALYKPFNIHLEVTDGTATLVADSQDWKGIKQVLEEQCVEGKVIKEERIFEEDDTKATCVKYTIVQDGRRWNIDGLPHYGNKNMDSTLVYIARKGRVIETRPWSDFMGITSHNSFNGTIGFITFTGEKLPSPCTTKVKMQDECPIFKKFHALIKTEWSKTKPKKAAKKAYTTSGTASVEPEVETQESQDIQVLRRLYQKYGATFDTMVLQAKLPA